MIPAIDKANHGGFHQFSNVRIFVFRSIIRNLRMANIHVNAADYLNMAAIHIPPISPTNGQRGLCEFEYQTKSKDRKSTVVRRYPMHRIDLSLPPKEPYDHDQDS